MNFDSEWLLQHLEGAPDADTVAERLTDCGCLVELREQGDGAEIWDVEVTTNRPDAMNHRGLAREAAVATGASLKELVVDVEESDEPCSELASIEIADVDVCTRFAARVVRGVRQVPSPEWLQRRLSNCGVRPINAVVDITNYVLLEIGQPLHAYDLAKVRGGRLVARRAAAGEELVTLDGETRKLDPEMAVIADADGVVGLAGIMGGANTEIGEDTVDVLLEAAHFDALTIRRAARRLGMHTEASHRFERGADPGMQGAAVDLAAAMMAELAGGSVCRGRIDVHPDPAPVRSMSFSVAALSAFAGLEIPGERVIEILNGLGFEPVVEGDAVTVTVPSFRIDIERTPDLYEEVIRHVGFAAIPSALPRLETIPGRRNPNWELVDRAREAAVSAGLIEVLNWSFIDPDTDALVDSLPFESGSPVKLDNPLAQTQGVMRRSLLPGMLAAASSNINQGERRLEFFEQGRAFDLGDDGPREHERLSVVLAGDSGAGAVTFARLKGVVEYLAHQVGLPPLEWQPGGEPWLQAHSGAVLCSEGRRVGLAGILAREYAARWSLDGEIAVLELDLDLATEPPLPKFEPLPRFPSVRVDTTVEHSADLSYRMLVEAVGELASEWVEDITHEARFLPGGDVIRTTLRFVYRHPERSLTQEEVNAAHVKLREGLAGRLGVTFA
jgi:phenylalanyl-tRNA synthetase beta chain